MPSPVGHSLFGLILYVLWCKNLIQWKVILWTLFCANLPDIDFFIGLAFGNMNRFHQGYTHTLGFALIVGIIGYVVNPALSGFAVSLRSRKGGALLTFLAVYTHVILDSINHDSRPPIGVMLFWPFSDKYFNPIQIFYAVPHSRIEDIVSSFFIRAAVREALLLSVPLLLLILWKRRGRA